MKNFFEGGSGLRYLKQLSHLFKAKNSRSRTLFSFFITLSYMLFSNAQAQSVGERAVASGGLSNKYNYVLYDAVTVKPIMLQARIDREKLKYPKVDLKKYPMSTHYVDTNKVVRVRVGEMLPDVVLDMPLWVVNDGYGRDTITLRNSMDREWVILDFWTEWCAPCVASMNKWEDLARTDDSIFTLIGVYADFQPHRAMPEARKKGYLSTQVIGAATSILKSVFLNSKASLGPSVWIRNGQLFGVSRAGMLKEEDYKKLLTGKLDAIPEYAVWKE